MPPLKFVDGEAFSLTYPGRPTRLFPHFWAAANHHVPYVSWLHPLYCTAWLLLIPIWREFHFYWIHRAIHWKPMYKYVHYLHHKNVQPVGRHRQIAALQFMRTLRPCLDALEPVLNREFDRPVIAAFEMQELIVAVTAPVAAVDRVASQQIERPGDVFAVALGQHQNDVCWPTAAAR